MNTERLLNVLTAAKPVIDAETFLNSEDLYGEGILDSLDILIAIDELCAEYGAKIDFADFSREDFKTVAAIYELVRRCGGRM
jgi:acyl carrier protein